MYQVRFLDSASKDLKKLDRTISNRIVDKIRWLANNFLNIKHDRLAGDLADFYKVRVGDYRIIYEVLTTEKVIIIHAIGHRKEIYKS